MILNSQEELNISTEAIKADALNNCARNRVLIGGRSNNSDNWNMFSVLVTIFQIMEVSTGWHSHHRVNILQI